MTSFLIYLTFFLLSLGHIGRISFFGQQVNGYWYEPTAAIILILLLLKYRLTPLQRIIQSKKSIVIFTGILIISYLLTIGLFSVFQNAVSFLYTLRFIFYVLIGTYMSYLVQHEIKEFRVLRTGFIIYTGLTIISGFVQYFFYPDLRNLFYLGWDPHLYRAFGFFLDTSIAGAVYGFLFLILFLDQKLISQKYVRYGFSSLLFILVILTFSRSLFIVFLGVGVWYLMRNKYYTLIAAFLIVFAGVLFLSPKPFGEGVNLLRTMSIQSRAKDDVEALELWQKQPVFGWGYNRIRYVKEQFHMINVVDEDVTHAGSSFHSSYLIVLVSTGVIGFLAFLYLLFQYGKSDEVLGYVVVFLGGFSIFDNIILHPFVLFLFFSYAALRLNRLKS